MQRPHLDLVIRRMLEAAPELSDILAVPGQPLQAEVYGSLGAPVPDITGPMPLTPFQTEAMALSLVGRNRRLLTSLATSGSCDLSYSLAGQARFRVNIFSRRGSLSMVLRRLPSRVPTTRELDLPEVFDELSTEKLGLVLVTGATGSGKSTSLAALVDLINERRAVHVITLEDPIEFVHTHKKATISQRELGEDFDSFASGLRAALRQAPKVILVGEIRDPETMEIALQAAETGHLVLGTLHTSDAGQTVSRILGMFDPSEERLIRLRLAAGMKAIVSQRLAPKVGGGRIALFEICKSTLRIRELIQQGEGPGKTFYKVLGESDGFGMRNFDQDLTRRYEQGLITDETAMLNASDRAQLGLNVDRIKKSRGERVSTIGGLVIDEEYDKQHEVR